MKTGCDSIPGDTGRFAHGWKSPTSFRRFKFRTTPGSFAGSLSVSV